MIVFGYEIVHLFIQQWWQNWSLKLKFLVCLLSFILLKRIKFYLDICTFVFLDYIEIIPTLEFPHILMTDQNLGK